MAERFQVPMPTKKDGWYEIPMWVTDAGAIPHPRHKWTLKDGTVVEPGEWIVKQADGSLSKAQIDPA